MHTQPMGGDPAQPGNAARTGPGTMAGKVALVRACEALKPEEERICYDPYAIRFVDPAIRQGLERNPDAFRIIGQQIESMLPGISGAIVARVRCFDEIVTEAVWAGVSQVVILGAGYDTRAYRIRELEKIRVFEIDLPATITAKMANVRGIFGGLPSHVTYIAVDLDADNFCSALAASGYDPEKKTIFLMEGLIMYLLPDSVDRLFAFIANNSPPGSSVLFDYCPEDDGKETGPGWQAGRSAAAFAGRQGEPLKSCMKGPVDIFLVQRGFSGVRNFSGDELRRKYFGGKNAGRTMCGIYSIASAIVGRDTCIPGGFR